MTVLQLYRWAGITGIVAAIANVIVEFLPERFGLPLDLVVNAAALWVLTALYLRQREASGRFGFIAYAVKSFGVALGVGFLYTQAFALSSLDTQQIAALYAGPTGVAAIVSLTIVTLGAILFCIATLRARVFPKWAALLLMAGFVLIGVSPFLPHFVKSFGEFVLSGGLMGMSYTLVAGTQVEAAARTISN